MQSEQIDQLATALAKAQGQIKNPVKNQKVTVTTKTGRNYTFEYADLTAIIDAVKKPLSENGIGYLQDIELVDGKYRLVTTLMHASGQFRSSAWPLFLDQHDRDGNVIPPTSQTFGSALTFMKRYALAAITGVSADSDDDANAAEGNDAVPVKTKPGKTVVHGTGGGPTIEPPSKAAEALIEIGKGVTVDPDTGELPPQKTFDWKAFGETVLEVYKQGGTADANSMNMLERMRTEKPKSYANLMKAIEKLTPQEPAQPRPEDDPDAYRVWLIDQISQFDSTADLNAHMKEQQKLWVGEKVFPPDIDEWTELYKHRAGELGK